MRGEKTETGKRQAKKPSLIVSLIVLLISICGTAIADITITFEEFLGHDRTPIGTYYPGIHFESASSGQDWIAGDVTTGLYNASSWPSGQSWRTGEYWMYDYVCAWTDIPGDDGKISFDQGAMFIELGYSAYSTLNLRAYDSSGNLLDSDSGPPNLRHVNGNPNGPGTLRVDWNGTDYIAYVVIGDTGNYWAVDNITIGYGPIKLTKVDDVNKGGCVGPGDEINYRIDYNYPIGSMKIDIVNFEDLAYFAESWLRTDCNLNNDCNGTDMNADGTVNFIDFALFAGNWLKNNVNIIDELPDEADFNSASDEGVYDSNTHTVTWNIGTLKPGDTNFVMLKVDVRCAGPSSTIRNKCEIKSGGEVINTVYEYTPGCWASNPRPVCGATDVPADVVLSWTSGPKADKHDIYLGTDYAAVRDANDPNTLPGRGRQNTNSYDPYGLLKLGQRYYWRIDEVNGACAPYLWEGYVWNFTVNHLVVENFNSYGDNAALRNAWKDYWSNGTCAEVYLATDPSRGGPPYQSMEYDFKNYTYEPYYSEAYADIADLPGPIDPNWLWMGAKSLSLWFYGQAGNDANQPMYVKLTDGDGVSGTVEYSGDMNDIKEPEWHQWNIVLQDFVDDNNVNLANVKRITIGFGDGTPATSDGTVYFEDITLYAPRCVLSKRSGGFAKVDYAPPGNPGGDCVADYQELEIMADYWLMTPPPAPNIDLYGDGTIDFKDFAILANQWLKEELWPY